MTIAHDALLTRWPRLHRWIEEAADDLVARDRLSTAATAWDADGRDPGGLLRGVRLDAAAQLRDRGTLVLDDREQALVDASLDAAEAERARIVRQLDRERRGNRRLRLAILTTIALLAVAVTAGVLAARQRTNADEPRTRRPSPPSRTGPSSNATSSPSWHGCSRRRRTAATRACRASGRC